MKRASITQADLEERQARIRLLDRAEAMIVAGASRAQAATALGMSQSTLSRWRAARAAGGDDALVPGKSTGRPPCVTLSADAAADIRRRYVKSNRQRHKGSMTYAARRAAKDETSPLTAEERAAILADRASKHLLPVSVRRACRGVTGDAAVMDYRDRDTRRLGGIYEPGMLRMVREPDGSIRRLFAGERQSWDDATINFCVVVPWPWRGDPVSERWGVRIGRFQLLAGIDDSTDFCVGWNYVIRPLSSYRADDVVACTSFSWRMGYMPERVMFEGGAWQAARTQELLRLSGVALDDAKGRAHSKLIEGFWGRLWTPLSEMSDGQVGRYRGEMDFENAQLAKCQAGSLDPRRAFPSLERALSSIHQAISYVNAERMEPPGYGQWVPETAHAAGLAARPRPKLSEAVEHLTLRERMDRTITRGMLKATAVCPLGDTRPYYFCSERMLPFDGAPVWLCFDPFRERVLAHVSLRERWRDYPAGHVIDAACPCVNAAPRVLLDEASGRWNVDFADGALEARRAKRRSSAVVRRELRSIGADGRRVIGESAVFGPLETIRQPMLGGAEMPAAPADAERIAAEAADVDIAALEKEAGILAG